MLYKKILKAEILTPGRRMFVPKIFLKITPSSPLFAAPQEPDSFLHRTQSLMRSSYSPFKKW